MAQLSNTPGALTTLRVEARKSFSFGVFVCDPNGLPVSLEGCRLVLVAKQPPGGPDTPNFLEDDSEAILEHPQDGYGRFELQAASLDQPAGEYPFAIVLYTAEDYTSVIIKGVLEIEENVDFEAVVSDYGSAYPALRLDVLLRDMQVINVFVGGQLPPGMRYISEDAAARLDVLDPDSLARIPEGGTPGYALTKIGPEDYSADWRPQNQGVLYAIGQPAGMVPTAQGDGSWDWDAVGIDATEADEGTAPLADGQGGWQWGEVSVAQPDWEAAPGTDAEILNKPELRSAATHEAEDFIAHDTLVSEMPGIHFVPTVPTTGIDGHLYFVYEL